MMICSEQVLLQQFGKEVRNIVRSGTPVGPDHPLLVIISYSKFSQGNVARFSAIVWVVGHARDSERYNL